MAKRIEFETSVKPEGFRAGLELIAREAKAANSKMQSTISNAGNTPEVVALLKEATIKRRIRDGQKRAAEELLRYQESLLKNSPASFLNPRGSMAADQAAWNTRLATAKKQVAEYRQIQSTIPPLQPFTTGRVGYGQANLAQAKAQRMGSFGSAASMFVSVARDSAASLASGAPAAQVIAQQLPQILQANAMLAMTQGKVGQIAAGILKWGLGIGLAVAALAGFHFATKSYFTLMAQGWSDLERRGEHLKKRGEELRALRAEQQAENEAAAKKSAESIAANSATAATARELATAKAELREAQEENEDKRNAMIKGRMEADVMLAGMQAEKSAPFEFTGAPGLRQQALDDQLALAKASTVLANFLNSIKPKPSESATPTIQKPLESSLPVSDSLVRVGNFLGSARGKIESLAQQQADLMRRYLPLIEANTRPGKASGDSWPNH